jgi:hypothetical protein
MTQPFQCYMILGGQETGEGRGPPLQFFWDPFKARAAFSEYPDGMRAWGTGCGYTAFLIAYEVYPDGSMRELAELGRK